MALPDTFDKLKELLTQDQFELLLDEEKKEEKQKIRLVYLMNDAVESFLVFHEARLTGEYRKEYEGELVSSLSEKEKDEIPGPRYVLVVHQGETVVGVFRGALSGGKLLRLRRGRSFLDEGLGISPASGVPACHSPG